MITYCDVIERCEDCPRYADDCDGDKYLDRYPTMHEYAEGKRINPKLTDKISRADAIDVIWKCYPYGIEHSLFDEMEEKLRALPSATLPMNDLISRENAIDAVKKEIQDFEANYMHDEDDEEYGHDIGFVAGLHRAKTFIRSLPSAEAPPYCVLGQRPPWSEPKTWHEKNGHTYICGDCGFEQAIYGNINEYNCCPRCGVYKEYVDYGGIFPQKRTPYKGGDTE